MAYLRTKKIFQYQGKIYDKGEIVLVEDRYSRVLVALGHMEVIRETQPSKTSGKTYNTKKVSEKDTTKQVVVASEEPQKEDEKEPVKQATKKVTTKKAAKNKA